MLVIELELDLLKMVSQGIAEKLGSIIDGLPRLLGCDPQCLLAALSSSRSVVVGPSVRPLVRPLVRNVCEKVTFRVLKGN